MTERGRWLPGLVRLRHRVPRRTSDASSKGFAAGVYSTPRFQCGSDTISDADPTKAAGGSVDVSGGWFDAGEGTGYPRCMQHQVGNLKGGANGSAPIATGAVVNGPNSAGRFSGGLGSYQTGMKHCPASGDPYAAFSGHGSRYVDDVRSWQSSEPALDMTGSAIAGAAFQQAVNSPARHG